MKLKIYRITLAISLLITSLLGLAIAIYNIVLSINGVREDESFFILLIALFMGALFTVFQFVLVTRSFKNGTILLHNLCYAQGSKKKNPAVLIVSSIAGSIFFILMTLVILCYAGVFEVTQTLMALEFDFYYCFIGLVNAVAVLTYYLFISHEDLIV